MHARGAGAHGYFKVYSDAAKKYTYAPVLTDSSRSTPTFVRFSTVQGSRGSAVCIRTRYQRRASSQSNEYYRILSVTSVALLSSSTRRRVTGILLETTVSRSNPFSSNHSSSPITVPVFFIQDAIKFPDIIHAVKPEPHNEVPTGQSAHNNFWGLCRLATRVYVQLGPRAHESEDTDLRALTAAHMVMWAMSDRGIPRSYRMMQGFGVNTFTLVNAAGERFFVKFHWLPELGVHSLMWDEALKINGQDPGRRE